MVVCSTVLQEMRYGFEEDWAEVYTSKNLPPESYPVGAQSRGHQIPFRLVCPDAGADF